MSNCQSFVSLSICITVNHVSVCLYVQLPIICLSIYMSNSQSFVCLSICLTANHLSVCLYVQLPTICPSVCMSNSKSSIFISADSKSGKVVPRADVVRPGILGRNLFQDVRIRNRNPESGFWFRVFFVAPNSGKPEERQAADRDQALHRRGLQEREDVQGALRQQQRGKLVGQTDK